MKDISIPMNGYKSWPTNSRKKLFIIFFSKKMMLKAKTTKRRVAKR